MKKVRFNIFFIIVLLVPICLNLIPHYIGWKTTPPGYFFSGQVSWFDPWDINNYLAAIRWGQTSRQLLYENLYTTTVSKPFLIYFLYTGSGIILPQLNPVLIYHGLSIITNAILVFTFYYCAKHIFSNRNKALLATLIISIGAGFGTLDLSIPGLTMFSVWQKPHEALALVFYINALMFYSKINPLNKLLSQQIGQLLFCLIGALIFYPFRVVPYLLITGIWSLWQWRNTRKKKIVYFWLINSIVGLITVLFFSYFFVRSGFSSLLTFQYQPLGLMAVITGYGFFLPLLLIYLIIIRPVGQKESYLLIWIFISLLLIFLPWGSARLFFNGLMFPLGMMAVRIIGEIFSYRLWLVLIILLVFPFTNYYIFYRRIRETGVVGNNWIYLPKSIKESFGFLSRQPEKNVLADYVIANQIPHYTGKHVFFGHWVQTPEAERKYRQLDLFYQGEMTDSAICNFLYDNHINYVLYLRSKLRSGQTVKPSSCLKSVLVNQDSSIYRVLKKRRY